MATRTELSLPQAQIQGIVHEGETLRIQLKEFYSFVSLTGSSEQTQWRQAGTLLLEDAEVEGDWPEGGFTLSGGDVQDNAYTYRDRVPLPLDARGHVGCVLRIEGRDEPLRLTGSRLCLQTEGERRYVRHTRDQ